MSYRNDNGANYDRSLLSSVPDPTRAEKQVRANPPLRIINNKAERSLSSSPYPFLPTSPSSPLPHLPLSLTPDLVSLAAYPTYYDDNRIVLPVRFFVIGRVQCRPAG